MYVNRTQPGLFTLPISSLVPNSHRAVNLVVDKCPVGSPLETVHDVLVSNGHVAGS